MKILTQIFFLYSLLYSAQNYAALTNQPIYNKAKNNSQDSDKR